MATSDLLLSHVDLMTSKSALGCMDPDHLPLLSSLATLEGNTIVTSVASDLLQLDPSPTFTNNITGTYGGKNASPTLPSWGTSNAQTNTGVSLPPVTELRIAARASAGLDFLGLLTNSGLNLHSNDSFIDFPILPKLGQSDLDQGTKGKVQDKSLDTPTHIPQSSLLLINSPSTPTNTLSTSLSQLIQSPDNITVPSSGVACSTANDLQFVEAGIPLARDYNLSCLSGLTVGDDVPSTQWDTSLGILNSADGVPKTPTSWSSTGDLLGTTAQSVDMLISNSVDSFPDIPDNIFAQTVEEILCYKCKFCSLYVSLSKDDATSHLKSTHYKELTQILPLPNWNTFNQSTNLSLKSSNPAACETQYLQGPLLTSSKKATETEEDGSFVCGKCQKTFTCLQKCTQHLAEVHQVKSSRIRLEKPECAKQGGKMTEQTKKSSGTVREAKASPDKSKKKTDSSLSNRKTKIRKSITPLQKFARQKLKREQGCYICEFKGCNVRYQLLDNLEYHRKCHILGSNCFSCPECGNQTERWAPMAGHLWRQHLIDLELNACDQCSFRTYSLTKLENLHKRTHGVERPYLCDHCGKKFKTSKQLYNHKTCHEEVTIKDTCYVCNRRFTDKRMLRVHMDNVHHKVRPFICNFCGYSASSRSTLKMHLRQHTGEKPFACDKCTYCTSDHNSLRRHKMRHSGEKPYKCPYCKYACIQSSTYKDHLKSKHPGQNEGLMFSCKECSFRTIKQDIFATHMSDHQMGLGATGPLRLATATSTAEVPSLLQELSLADALQISIDQPSSLRLLGALTNNKPWKQL